MSIGTKIKAARMRAGVTLRELAERIGCDNGGLSRIESPTSNPTWATIERIAEGLGMTTTELLAPLSEESTERAA